METTIEQFTESFKKLSRLPDDVNIQVEAEHLKHLIDGELKDLLDGYTFTQIEGVGGSGIVFSSVFEKYNNRRAIKVPRKRIFENADATAEDPELDALAKLSHKNITRLYNSKQLSKGSFCAITEYVDEALPLDLYTKKLCCSEENRLNEYTRNNNLKKLAFIIYDVVEAIEYMHKVGKLIHFDIKPDNILVSIENVAYITDLGFARDMDKHKNDSSVEIGFTYKYAHKDLLDPHHGARVSNTPLKAKNKIPGKLITPVLDLFAFGRTLQEILKILEKEYAEEIHSSYIFNYLHLVSALCLDGKGSHDFSPMGEGDFMSDTALGIDLSIFNEKKYFEFTQVKEALKRLLSLKAVEEELPELDIWSANTINVSDIGITTMTPRVNSILKHPVFEKLYDEHQLGMMDAIFPTASHTRFQHSLGVYHATSQYLLALYNDKENPTFRVFFDSGRCAKLLLSSLVHDLGQTSFGHELEEIDNREFSHEDIGRQIISSDLTSDNQGRSLQKIIEGDGEDQWGIKIDELYQFMKEKSDDPFDSILYDIFDGQIDADKLDYLIRDSKESRVSYGYGIDYARFLRSLTTYSPQKEAGKKAKLRLAIKRKGSASAESFVFARYQLYQSLYWHHTFRAIKAMFLSSAFDIIQKLKTDFPKDSNLFTSPLRTIYLNYVIGLSDESLGIKEKSALKTKTKSIINNPFAGKYGTNKTLNLLWNLADEPMAKALLKDIINRNIYKRVFELPLSKFRPSQVALFNNDKRKEFETQVNEAMIALLQKKIQDSSQVRESTKEDKIFEKFQELIEKYKCFVIDFPTRGWTPSGKSPAFVVDFKRRHFRVLNYQDNSSIEQSKVWSELQSNLMKEIAEFRIYCHPDMHIILRKHVSSEEIFQLVAGTFQLAY